MQAKAFKISFEIIKQDLPLNLFVPTLFSLIATVYFSLKHNYCECKLIAVFSTTGYNKAFKNCNDYRYLGCLPFTWENRLVDGLYKW